MTLLNRLDVDAQPVLKAKNPRIDIEAVYRGLLELEREAAEERSRGSG